MSKNEIVENIKKLLMLKPHPEGGFYRETFVDNQSNKKSRALSSVIYFLIEYDKPSKWHRVDATEVWFWHIGAPVVLTMSSNGCDAEAAHLGSNILLGQNPHVVVPANVWQTAETLGEWTLLSCMVSPSFSFDGFETAPADWFPSPKNRK